MHTHYLVEQLACNRILVGGIHNLCDHWNAAELADHIGIGQQLVACLDLALLELDRSGAQHQVREVYVPLMRRHVRALRHVA